MSNDYDSSQIRLFEGREAVRMRPGMYLGDKDEHGLHQLIYELLNNSINEVIRGFCKKIQIVLHIDNSVTVQDNGSGIPVNITSSTNLPVAELILTTLKPGRKFDGNPFLDNAPFGAGAACVNFLSEWLELEIQRDGMVFQQNYQTGIPVSEFSEIGDTTKTGTKIHFKPDSTCFTVTEFNFEKLSDNLRQKAALNSGVEIILVDERGDSTKDLRFYSEKGLADFVNFLCREKSLAHSNPIHFIGKIPETEISIEVAFLFSIQSEEKIVSFANHHPTPNGGKHVSGFYAGLIHAINQYAQTKHKKLDLPANKIREGLVSALAVTLPQPRFEVSTRSSLQSEISEEVQSFVYQNLMHYFSDNPEVADKIINHLWQEK